MSETNESPAIPPSLQKAATLSSEQREKLVNALGAATSKFFDAQKKKIMRRTEAMQFVQAALSGILAGMTTSTDDAIAEGAVKLGLETHKKFEREWIDIPDTQEAK